MYLRTLANRTIPVAVIFALLVPSTIADAAGNSTPGVNLLKAVNAAVAHEQSVHVVSVDTGKGVTANGHTVATVDIVTDAGSTEGSQQVTYKQGNTIGHEFVEDIGGVGYFRGDSFTLHNFNGFSATAAGHYASKWLSVVKTDNAFTSVTSSLLMSTIPAQIAMPSAPHLLAGLRTVLGVRVKSLQATATVESVKVTVVLFVRASGAPLPVEEKITAVGESNGSATFSGWDESIRVTTPSSSIPFSSTGQ
jgi:hypothetical protein